MAHRRVTITLGHSAVSDLGGILQYYADQNVPSVGDRLVRAILAAIERLAHNPDMGRIVPEFGVKHLRELIRPPFRIVYRREGTKIQIVRVWRSERLLKLAENR